VAENGEPTVRYDWISATTDYGTDDGFVAACVGVIARIAPHARVIDVTHAVPAGDVRRGAAVLAQTVPYLPPAVHVAVVDPGVGTARRGVAVRVIGRARLLYAYAARAAHRAPPPARTDPSPRPRPHRACVTPPAAGSAPPRAPARPPHSLPAVSAAGLERLALAFDCP